MTGIILPSMIIIKGKEKVEGNSIKKELEGGPENEAAGEHQAYCGFSTENVVNT